MRLLRTVHFGSGHACVRAALLTSQWAEGEARSPGMQVGVPPTNFCRQRCARQEAAKHEALPDEADIFAMTYVRPRLAACFLYSSFPLATDVPHDPTILENLRPTIRQTVRNKVRRSTLLMPPCKPEER